MTTPAYAAVQTSAVLEPAEDVSVMFVVEVPFSCFARAWNAANVFALDSSAFTEKTIPDPQWFACLQKAQMGVV